MNDRTFRHLSIVAVAAMSLVACGNDTDVDTTADPASTVPSSPATVDTTIAPVATAPAETIDTSTTEPDVVDDPGLRVVAIGDSIPYNSPEDCPGCTSFVDRYATALEAGTGRPVDVENASQHNGLTLPMLMDELGTYEDDLRDADAIIVGVAHNSIALNEDHPCGSNWVDASNTFDDWTKLTPDCAASSAETYRPMYADLFSTIATWREGEPTVLLTINRYSDWLGWTDAHLTPEMEATTVTFLDAWNSMLCETAESNGFTCVDIYHAFNGSDGSAPAGDLLAADYTHPSDSGNELIARLLAEPGFAPLA